MTTHKDLLAKIERFLRQTGLTPTRLGIEACGDSTIIRRLRDGHGCTIRRYDELISYMAKHGKTRPAVPSRGRLRKKGELSKKL